MTDNRNSPRNRNSTPTGQMIRRCFSEAIQEAMASGLGDESGAYMAHRDGDDFVDVLVGIAGLRRWAIDRKVELSALRSTVNVITADMLVEAHEWVFETCMCMCECESPDDVQEWVKNLLDLLEEECHLDVSRERAIHDAAARW